MPDDLPPGIWKLAFVMVFGPAMSLADITMVNMALPSISYEFGVPVATVQWATGGYLLAMATVLPATAWLTDRFGSGKLHRISMAAFVALTLCGALAPTVELLVAFRLGQGAAAGILVPLSQLVLARAAGANMARVVGISAVPVYLAPMLGPIAGGQLVAVFGWHSVFLVNVPLGLIAIILSWLYLGSEDAVAQRKPFDIVGFALASSALAFALSALHSMTEGPAMTMSSLQFAFAVALGGAFVRRCLRRRSNALLDIGLFRHRGFRLAAGMMFLANGVNMGLQFVLPWHFMTILDIAPQHAGLLMAPIGFGGALVVPLIGRLVETLSEGGIAMLGSAIAAVAVSIIAVAGADLGLIATAAVFFLTGAGLGLVTIPTFSLAYRSVPRDSLTMAMPMLNIVQRLGGPVSTTGLATILTTLPGFDGVRTALIAAAVMPLSLIVTFGNLLRTR